MEHLPVLLTECIEGLNIKPDGIYVDGTLGRGGHAREIAKRLSSGRLIAIDRDEEAIKQAKQYDIDGKMNFIHGNFKDISRILSEENIDAVDGMLFDLGVSSPQLDNAGRGFSYMQDASLDMRMDKQDSLTAFEVVNSWPEEELKKIFFQYGEEKYAREISRAIARYRMKEPINTTFELNDIIFSAIPAKARRENQHPSKRCFQALRIAVNDELGSIEKMLMEAPDKLKIGGRLCVISFHSLEDRLVKIAFNSRVNGCICPKDAPVCICGFKPSLKLITKKPIIPRELEIEANARARSAKLRIAEKI
ncbi:MAG: 16S rRNA (cytosine(1402)-N(4))-methyltransferase RsmH [Oscillospiraceae bacterium]|nr:16S rRNA (cytosine(1402)-N(4))-methyltransferase RsmH [Oscillospiraceae bacterium]